MTPLTYLVAVLKDYDVSKRSKEIAVLEKETEAEQARKESEQEKKRAYALIGDLVEHRLAKERSEHFFEFFKKSKEII